MADTKTPLSITLSTFERALLEALAADQDRSLSYMAGLAIERYAYSGNANDRGPMLTAATLERIERENLPDEKAER
jgi:hypothetical protein